MHPVSHCALDIYRSCRSYLMDDAPMIISRRVIAGAAGLLAVFFAVLVFSSKNDSATFDEVAHIPAGYSYLKYKDARINPEHPPLIKDLAALPLLFLDIKFPKDASYWDIANVNDRQWLAGNALLYRLGNDPARILFWSRLPLMLLSVAFGALIFWWTYRWYGAATGFLALLFFVSSPTVIAHSRLVTTDIGAAFGFFVGMLALFCFLRRRTTRSMIVFGIVLGVIQLFKFSLVLMLPISIIAGVLWLLLRREPGILDENSRRGRAVPEFNPDLVRDGAKEFSDNMFGSLLKLFARLFIAGIIALLVIWAVYAFHIWNYPPEQQQADMRYMLEGYKVPIVAETVFWLAEHPATRPLAQYFYGFLTVARRTAGGNTAFFQGEVSADGWFSYFPTLLATKEQLALFVFLAIALWYGCTRALREWRSGTLRAFCAREIFAVVIGAFIVFYFLWSVASPLNIGVRHALPILPFVYILAAYGVVSWIRQQRNAYPVTAWGTAHKLYEKYIKPAPKYALTTVLVVWMTAEVGAAFPHFLSYYNALGGGTLEGYRIATDSNYDWGQDLKRLRDWTEENNISKIYLDYFGGGSPPYEFGAAYEGWWSSRGTPPSGAYFAVSLNTLMGAWGTAVGDVAIQKEDSYEWLRGKTPIARAGTSILIFKIN